MATGSGEVYVSLEVSGEGLDGTYGSGAVDFAVSLEGNSGATGYLAEGSLDLLVGVSGSVLFGTAGAGSVDLALAVSGILAPGYVGTGAADVVVGIGATSGSGNTGSGEVFVAVRVSAGVGLPGVLGQGSVAVEVGAAGSGFANLVSDTGTLTVVLLLEGNGQSAEPLFSVAVFSMNLSNAAVTEHDSGYNSLAVCGGETYAAAASTVYRLTPTAACSAVVAKYGMDFGSSLVKYLTEVYLHLESRGPVALAVSSESTAGTTTAVDSVPYMHTCKVAVPRGIRGRSLGFTFQNTGGADFRLREVELLLAESVNRRTRQRRG